MSRGTDAETSEATLLDLRDELAVTRQLVVALWLACQAPHLPEAERRALSALASLVREHCGGCLRTSTA